MILTDRDTIRHIAIVCSLVYADARDDGDTHSEAANQRDAKLEEMIQKYWPTTL